MKYCQYFLFFRFFGQPVKAPNAESISPSGAGGNSAKAFKPYSFFTFFIFMKRIISYQRLHVNSHS